MSEKSPKVEARAVVEKVDSKELPTANEILDSFRNKREKLESQLAESTESSNLRLGAVELFEKKQKEKELREERAALDEEWAKLGGADIDKAQRAVDSLNFQSEAEEHIDTKMALRDAQGAFYKNFIANAKGEDGGKRVAITEEDLDDNQTDNETKRIIIEENDLEDEPKAASDGLEESSRDEDKIETARLDAVEVISDKKSSLWQELKSRYYGNFGNIHARAMEIGKNKWTKRATLVGLGALAGYFVAKGTIDSDTASNMTASEAYTGGIDTSSIDTSMAAPSGSETVASHDVGIKFSDTARHIDSGEGFYQTFKEMKIPQSEWANLLDKVGPRLQEQGIAYPMGDSWGINMTSSGKMPDSALRIIENARANR